MDQKHKIAHTPYLGCLPQIMVVAHIFQTIIDINLINSISIKNTSFCILVLSHLESFRACLARIRSSGSYLDQGAKSMVGWIKKCEKSSNVNKEMQDFFSTPWTSIEIYWVPGWNSVGRRKHVEPCGTSAHSCCALEVLDTQWPPISCGSDLTSFFISSTRSASAWGMSLSMPVPWPSLLLIWKDKNPSRTGAPLQLFTIGAISASWTSFVCVHLQHPFQCSKLSAQFRVETYIQLYSYTYFKRSTKWEIIRERIKE